VGLFGRPQNLFPPASATAEKTYDKSIYIFIVGYNRILFYPFLKILVVIQNPNYVIVLSD